MVKFEPWKPISPHENTRVHGSLNGPDGIVARYSVEKLRLDAEAAITDLEAQHTELSRAYSSTAEMTSLLDEQCSLLYKNQEKAAAIIVNLESRVDVVSKGFTACVSALDIVKKKSEQAGLDQRIAERIAERIAQAETSCNETHKEIDVVVAHLEDRVLRLEDDSLKVEQKDQFTDLEDRILQMESEMKSMSVETGQTYTLLTGAYILGSVAICMCILNY